jgi:hypothetical protein
MEALPRGLIPPHLCHIWRYRREKSDVHNLLGNPGRGRGDRLDGGAKEGKWKKKKENVF